LLVVNPTNAELLYLVHEAILRGETKMRTRQETGDLIKLAGGLAIFIMVFLVVSAHFNLSL